MIFDFFYGSQKPKDRYDIRLDEHGCLYYVASFKDINGKVISNFVEVKQVIRCGKVGYNLLHSGATYFAGTDTWI